MFWHQCAVIICSDLPFVVRVVSTDGYRTITFQELSFSRLPLPCAQPGLVSMRAVSFPRSLDDDQPIVCDMEDDRQEYYAGLRDNGSAKRAV